jgi:hypothetical protein
VAVGALGYPEHMEHFYIPDADNSVKLWANALNEVSIILMMAVILALVGSFFERINFSTHHLFSVVHHLCSVSSHSVVYLLQWSFVYGYSVWQWYKCSWMDSMPYVVCKIMSSAYILFVMVEFQMLGQWVKTCNVSTGHSALGVKLE